MTLEELQIRLSSVTEKVTQLIGGYALNVDSPLDVIGEARSKITVEADYIRFLELSLERLILAEEGERLLRNPPKTMPPPP